VTPQLGVLFAQHKTAILGASAAGVAGLALLQKRKKAATGSGTTAVPGTIPAAAVVSSGVQGAYPDTSGTSGYDQLEGQLERLQASQAVPVPTPVSSTLFAPSSSGSLVRFNTGAIDQIQGDGSLYNLTPGELQNLYSRGGVTVQNLDTPEPTNSYGLAKNLATANKTS
jgi:hypothetical protein